MCKSCFDRTTKQINAVIKRSSRWVCKKCSTEKTNKSRSSSIGATRTNKKGYVEEKTDSGWLRQHRIVMESAIGRKLLSHELVHHKDGNKSNNSPSNLEIEVWGEHTKTHHLGSKRKGSALRNIRIAFEFKRTAKLSIKKAEEIKARYANGETQRSIAKELGVSPMTISRAARGESWKNHDVSE